MWLLVDMLRDVPRRGTAARAVNGSGLSQTVLRSGGKTGTTDDGTDVWYIGFTRELVTGIWMGFDQRARITQVSGGGILAAPVWAQIMREVYSRRPRPGSWPRPDGLRLYEIDAQTGFLHTVWCPPTNRKWEWFVPGTEPVEPCPDHNLQQRRFFRP